MFIDDNWKPRAHSLFDWSVLYAGYLYQSATGLQVSRCRVYSPYTAWATRDPLGTTPSAASLYSYVASKPLSFADPLGLKPYPTWYLRLRDKSLKATSFSRDSHVVIIPSNRIDNALRSLGVPADITHYAQSGCRGVVGSIAGFAPHAPTSWDNCYTSLAAAKAAQAKMRASNECASQGQKNVFGSPAGPALFAFTFREYLSADNTPSWTLHKDDRITIGTAPDVYDYQLFFQAIWGDLTYNDPISSVWLGGESNYSGPNGNKYNDMRAIATEAIEWYNNSVSPDKWKTAIRKDDDTGASYVRATVYCVKCEGDGAIFKAGPSAPSYSSEYWELFWQNVNSLKGAWPW